MPVVLVFFVKEVKLLVCF